MIIALWIIAVCEVIRIVQNTITLIGMRGDKDMREKAFDEYIKSLHQSDDDFVKGLVKIISTSDSPVENPEVKIGCDLRDIPSDLMTLEQARQAVKDLRTSNIHLRMQLNEKEENEK